MNRLAVLFGCIAVALGNPLDGRIVGGDIADINNFPYIVSVGHKGGHFCGGSILDSRRILTAAHCMKPKYMAMIDEMTVRAGSADMSYGGQLVGIEKAIKHPKYVDASNMDYDIAVLFLKEDLKYGPSVRSIPMERGTVLDGTSCVVSGWGVTNGSSGYLQTQLRYVGLNVITESKCKDLYGTRHIVTKNMLCTLTTNKDACTGDSGGPLAANGKLIGVVSWGIGCARADSPGVFTKVSEFYHWVASISS